MTIKKLWHKACGYIGRPLRWLWDTFWFKKLAAEARFAGWVARLTLVLCVIGAIQAWAFIISERAFVFLTPDTLSPSPLQSGKQIVIGISVHNTGKSEGLLLGSNTTFIMLETPLPETPAYTYNPNRFEAIPGQVGAGIAFDGTIAPKAPNGSPGTLSTDQITAINSGQIRLYVFGWVEYKDAYSVFGSRKTGFCAVYSPTNPADHAFNNCGRSKYTYVN